ncbi:TenA family protein [Aureimonas mangrovi]|uniref:TenA family protein n=1 Tax=Aureimonas mangrovi TaxID=2758041 RepID=UPI00163D810C|nr:TenA family protein [Aureimonas mangrovi]
MNERFTEALRQAASEDWQATIGHRFVDELLAGTIDDAVMARYLVQDHRFLDAFLMLLGAAQASADNFTARLRLARFGGMIAGEENTYFERSFEALGVDNGTREATPDTEPTAGFKAIMREAATMRSYAGALSVLCVAEWSYLEWAMRADARRPDNFVHDEWITLHDNPAFRDFVVFLRAELDRVGPHEDAVCRDLFTRAVRLERAFFDAAYEI